jgi:hypothetical protein
VAIGLLAATPEGRGIVTIQPESRRPPVGAVVAANLAKGLGAWPSLRRRKTSWIRRTIAERARGLTASEASPAICIALRVFAPRARALPSGGWSCKPCKRIAPERGHHRTNRRVSHQRDRKLRSFLRGLLEVTDHYSLAIVIGRHPDRAT